MSFLRHGQIFQSDVELYKSGRRRFRLRPECHRLDELCNRLFLGGLRSRIAHFRFTGRFL